MTSEPRHEHRPPPRTDRSEGEDATHVSGRPRRPSDDPAVPSLDVSGRAQLHQAAVLGLQRTVGNGAVVRRLGAAGDGSSHERPSGPTVQRGGPSAPAQEFVPVVPPQSTGTPLRLFARYTHTWTVANAAAAPRGTFFHWGHGLEPNGVGQLLSSHPSRAGATTQLRISVRRPGQLRIQGTPVHQVPGGPRVTGEVRWAVLPVAAPTLTLLGIMPRKPDGSGADSAHLSPGDKLVVRVRVGNVDGRHIEDSMAVALTGTGLGKVAITGGVTAAQSFPDGRSYDVELTALSPGSLDLGLELGIADSVLGQGPKVQGISGEVEMDRQEFLNRCGECSTRIELAYTQANSIMEVLSAAYGNAYDRHDKVLEAQDASNRLVGDILLGAALAFVPGGVGGVVGGWMKNAKAGDFLADAVKDLAKAGTRGIENAVVPGAGAGPAMQPMGDDPRTWRAKEAVRVNSEKKYVLGVLLDWQNKVNGNNPSFYRNFDPVERMSQSLVRGGRPLVDVPVPDQAEHERLFELGMWKGWLENFAFSVERRTGRYGETYSTVVENQGKKIRDRINALGQDGDAFLEQYGAVARRKAEAAARGGRS